MRTLRIFRRNLAWTIRNEGLRLARSAALNGAMLAGICIIVANLGGMS